MYSNILSVQMLSSIFQPQLVPLCLLLLSFLSGRSAPAHFALRASSRCRASALCLTKRVRPSVSCAHKAAPFPSGAGLICWFKLTVIQVGVEAVLGEEFGVCPMFNDIAVFHNEDHICITDSR